MGNFPKNEKMNETKNENQQFLCGQFFIFYVRWVHLATLATEEAPLWERNVFSLGCVARQRLARRFSLEFGDELYEKKEPVS